MWSGPNNNIFMDQDTYKNIITGYNIDNEQFEIQLTGGEPLIHPNFLGYVEFACNQSLISKIIIITNGVVTDNYIEQLYKLSQQYSKQIVLKISINYYIVETNPNHLKQIQNWSKIYPNSDYWLWCLSIRCREPKKLEQSWLNELEQNNYFGLYYNIYPINFEQRAKKNKVQGASISSPYKLKMAQPYIYACDGTYFGNNFKMLKQHEEQLSNEK